MPCNAFTMSVVGQGLLPHRGIDRGGL